MDLEKRLALIEEVGEEVITREELRQLLESNVHPVAYDGFEPSGRIHIAQGVLRAINVNKMTKAGCKFIMFVADWHGWANNKMGGDLEKIRLVGKYFIEVWKQTEMDLKKTEFVWASELLSKQEYWKTVMQIARESTLKRVLRTTQIMGRSEDESLQASQILYPCMQAADIFEMNVDIAQLGMDQRKVNVLARELAPSLKKKKPVAVHHHMLLGLSGQKPGAPELEQREKQIQFKMSKSNPDSAIFMTDSKEEIERKIGKAYCLEKSVENNPVLEYCKYLVFNHEKFGGKMKIERPAKFGGDAEYSSFSALESDFLAGKLHPLDLKKATVGYVDRLVAPVREHFEKNKKARDLLQQVQSFEVTR
jgi:tyrosyl-tRNA synthetase